MKDRTAAKNRGKALTLSLLKRQNAQRPRTDRSPDRDSRSRNPPDCRSRRKPSPIASPSTSQHSRRIQHHRLCLADRNAGARLRRNRPGRQPRRPGSIAPRQSGRWTSRSFIRGGRADVRQALYMPALVAARFNPDMKVKYAHLIQTGKPAKVALTAIMRKQIVLINALPPEANRPWTPKTA